mmetsp:Transcript_104834/g.262594  ORF Transcript_104834/g.262594 Transcript_104834/m.262594 type:complete len:300 (-) Transcript_104834:140-1039(-)
MAKMNARLSEVPEGATIRCHLTFALIGPDADEVAKRVSECNAHTDVEEVAAYCKLQEAPGRQSKYAWSDSAEVSDDVGDASLMKADDGRSPRERDHKTIGLRTIYCMLDEDEIAKVRLKIVASFKDSLNDKNITEGDPRNTCFIYLMDPRRDLGEDVLPVLNQAFAEMNFLSAKTRTAANGLRAKLLIHEDGPRESVESDLLASQASTWASQSSTDVEEAPELGDFASKLCEFVKVGCPRRLRKKVNFDSGDAVYGALQRHAREMFKANTKSAFSSSLSRMNSLFDTTPQAQKRCCAIQ